MNPVTPGRSSLSSGGFSVDSILYIISKQTLCLSSSLKMRRGDKTKIKDYYLVLHCYTENQKISTDFTNICFRVKRFT